MELDFRSVPPLRLLVKPLDGGEPHTVQVELCDFSSFKYRDEQLYGAKIRISEKDQLYEHEVMNSDIIGLMESILHDVMLYLNFGPNGHRGLDYELYDMDGRPWRILRHLQFKPFDADQPS
jgi:hypothetical protein